jgi:hypothetical protein
MTWLMRISASSTATQKLYTGRPLLRMTTKSPTALVLKRTSPRTASSTTTSWLAGARKR